MDLGREVSRSDLDGWVEKTRPPRHQRGQQFLKGPIPLDWLILAAGLPGKSLAVGLGLWVRAGMKNQRRFSVPRSLLREFQVGAEGLRESLVRLERAGLIVVVERRQGCSPVVELLEAPSIGMEVKK